MKHWLKRALATAALASGAMIATAGMASASSESPLPVDPEAIISLTQEATNTNETNQNAEPSAETNQVNVYAPIAVLSKDSNNGKVDQSNEAETTVVAVNKNGTEQSIDQDQTASDDRGGCGKCGSEGETSQSQTAENNNTTNQNAEPSATTNQSNEIGSDRGQPGASKEWKGDGSHRENGGAEQSNEADTTVVAINENGTEQSIDQDQTAQDKDDRDHKDKDDRDHKDKDDRDHKDKDDRDHKDKDDRDHKDKDGRGHKDKDGRGHKGKDCLGADCDRCVRTQSQTAGNNNTSNQNAAPGAQTYQSNTSDRGQNDLDQSNEAGTEALAANRNGAGQSIGQSQHLSS